MVVAPEVSSSQASMEELVHEQAWLSKRFAGLTPKHFNDNMLITVQDLDPPAGFSDRWWNITHNTEALVDLIHNGDSPLLILVNLSSPRQVATLLRFLATLECSPPLVLVPHSCAPELRSQKKQSGSDCFHVIQNFVAAGAHDLVVGEPEGFKLACAVQARARCQLMRITGLSEVLDGYSNEKAQQAYFAHQQRAHQLKECIDTMLWEYLRIRLGTDLPAIDHSIAPGEPHQIDNFECGTVLGKGSFGTVFMIKDTSNDPSSAAQVIKSVSKKEASINFLKALKNEFKAMQLLTEKWAHPNIIKLYDVYHSKTHLFFRMECGGLENLSQRLKSRDSTGDKQSGITRPLSLVKAVSVMKQCAAVMAHLHNGPRIAHRDIKPGNIIFSETDDHAMIKLSDFGLAHVATHKSKSRIARGTLPFMAPEAILEESHDLFAADVWSMGIVFLELTCFVGFVQQILFTAKDSSSGADRSKERKRLMRAVHSRFSEPGCVKLMLDNHLRHDLESLASSSTALLGGMLNLSPSDRFNANDVVDWCPGLVLDMDVCEQVKLFALSLEVQQHGC